ncbi:Protein of unknown function [Duganella sp. CF517]|uniref:DUF3999 family protein n=1 Tax=Duganella sp. CF517 TaxID=1881038 RepID=UPI0008B8689A|nr:DUF3999 family protein [Duganella sp. CF517]SEO48629.1 Protein of unknown function [Duganella sp. CF517]
MKTLLIAAALGLSAAALPASAADSDAPKDYTHLLPLSAGAKQGVLQVRLPRDVYLHARTPLLDDVRVFDARGVPQPFALRAPDIETSIGHKDLPLTVFPLTGAGGADSAASQLDLDVSTAPDGRLLSVKVRPERGADSAGPARLKALILDLGKPAAGGKTPPVNALRFTLPPDRRDYSAQVWLETSDDMKRWDTVGAAELNWLVNQDAQTLANDRLDFDARTFRYARLTWRSGTPLQFAAVTAEQPVRTDVAPPGERLVLQPAAGDQPGDLVYKMPLAVAPVKVGLQFAETNVVLPATVGVYRAAPARQAGAAPQRRFEPVVATTFYRIAQGGQARASGDLDVAPRHAPLWVLRTAAPASVQPALRVEWQPATLIFLGSGNAPYTLAVGRERAAAAARPVDQVAPGFADSELQTLERATAGPATAQQGAAANADAAALAAASAAQRRLLLLWGVLLLGVGVLAFMVWRLLQPKSAT